MNETVSAGVGQQPGSRSALHVTSPQRIAIILMDGYPELRDKISENVVLEPIFRKDLNL